MDLQEAQRVALACLRELANQFHRVPGSAIFLRYVKSSYQNDPVRSAVELFLFLSAVRYLLAPKYSTNAEFRDPVGGGMLLLTKEQAKKPLTRRFIITEALFENRGDMVDLPKIIELRLKYKFRLILDETWSFGVLGRTGRGITEHQNVDPTQVDMIVGSLAGPLIAGGGFCAGSEEIVHHQRISATSYCFSAALPALLSTTASETLTLLQESPELLSTLRENIKIMWSQLDPRSDWVYCSSAPESPIMFLALKPEVVSSRRLSIEDQQHIMQDAVDEALANGVLITRLKTIPDESGPKLLGGQVPPALKVCLTTGLSKKEVEKAGTVIRHAITKVMRQRR
ncbi:hypothetical protein UREG_05462 [Uncinocarpus reesii 1704]|uniref:serine C-palmitoyltransferase n=1 Tax=Uncinocarpus reesii (strain UAMH 1704) TaxID=336963 RepID=C4JSM3_UNCRE|nr:uncharacterized protein UREG_05462 [Uncinocarpus reesii 1704]EEP80620.1 hypothetical protein UREG_05462 [Uncinocarpus reesii 1704]